MTDVDRIISTMSPVQKSTLRGLKAGGSTLARGTMSGAVRKALFHHGLIDEGKNLTPLGHEVINHLEDNHV